ALFLRVGKGSQRSAADALKKGAMICESFAGVPPGAEHSAVIAGGQLIAGGTVSWTVTFMSSVPVDPALSVTVSFTMWVPGWIGPEAVPPLTSAFPPSDQSYRTMSLLVPGVESGSALAEPSSVGLAPRFPWHSRTWSGPASATGGWFPHGGTQG